ncbi:MAG: hypothetical protein AAF840_05825 [Bacteroidota bacterium]
MTSSNPYLNPIELLGLTDHPALTTAELRKARKRFLTELQLDEKEDFRFHGQRFTQHDLDQAVTDITGLQLINTYQAAAAIPNFSRFLVTGDPGVELAAHQLSRPLLAPILQRYFVPAFNQAFSRSLQQRNHQQLKKLLGWIPSDGSIPASLLFEGAYRALEKDLRLVESTLKAYLENPNSQEGKALKGMQIFRTHFPHRMINLLPEYFADLNNRLTHSAIDVIIRLNNERRNPGMALSITKQLLQLQHLSEGNRKELGRLKSQLSKNFSTRTKQRQQQSGGGEIGIGRIIGYIIMAILMVARIGTCISENNASRYRPDRLSYNQYQPYQAQEPAIPGITPEQEKLLRQLERESYGHRLRKRVYEGKSLKGISRSAITEIPSGVILPLMKKDAGVREANQVLRLLELDTILHEDGTLTDTTDIQRRLKEAFYAKRQEIADVLLPSLGNKQQRDRNPAPTIREKPSVTPEPVAKQEVSAQPKTSFRRKEQQNFLGPQARVPANYYVYNTNTEHNDGRLMKMRTMLDDYELGALIIWKDTLGLRQVRIPGFKSIPTTFNVAKGDIDNLLDAHVVYGRKWQKDKTSPWGGQGWFEKVTCYCGPKDHKGFINGKKSYRKNFWLPASTIDPSKSMSPAAFLRSIKRQ